MTTNQTQIAVGSAFKKLTFSLFLLFTCVAFAQVGVGTQTPATTLDVVGAAGNTPGALNTIDGIAVPVVTDDMTTTTTTGSKVSQLVYSNNAASTGFYFWDGTAWTAMGGGAAGPDFSVGVGGILEVDALTTPDLSANTDNNVLNYTQTGAGPGSTQITLPTAATNEGRIILIKNNGAKQLQVTNAHGFGSILSSGSTIFICDGVEWVKTQ